MSRPYFKLYSRDFRDGVRPLSLEETGAYTLLLTLIYDAGGPIADDGEAIRRQLGCDRRVWVRLRARLLDLGKLRLTEDGYLTNGRAEREIADQTRVSEVRSEIGRVGGERSGAARWASSDKSGQSPGKVRAKSGKSPADFSVLPCDNPLKTKDSPEAIASKPYPYSEYISSTAPNGAAEHSRARDAALLVDNAIATVEKLAAKPPDPDPKLAIPERSLSAPGQRRQKIVEACFAAAGPGLADPDKTPNLHLTAPRIAAAIAAGCDFEADVLPVIRAKTALPRINPIASWAWFEAAWIAARNERLRPMPPPPDPDIADNFVRFQSKGLNHDFAEPRTYAQKQSERSRKIREDVLREFGVVREPEFVTATVVC